MLVCFKDIMSSTNWRVESVESIPETNQ